jgi:enamine deaminase RidA (YjgF/YER057c/UK114 family)
VVSRSFSAQVLQTPAWPQGMNTLSQGQLQQIKQSFTELSDSVFTCFLSFFDVYKVELILDKVIVAFTVLKILLIE